VTSSPRVEPLRFAALDDVAAAIRAQGGRLTAARRMILETLFAADGPVSAEHIAERLDERGAAFDLTSIYRNLERMEGLGVVRHVHLGHGPGLYSLVGEGVREYLVCERCGRARAIEPGELDGVRRVIRRRFGYDARFSHFPITGLCPECAAAG
jgi:Fur family transcriptional regulator, ferric uptake regulator